jgi:hypothetical protein
MEWKKALGKVAFVFLVLFGYGFVTGILGGFLGAINFFSFAFGGVTISPITLISASLTYWGAEWLVNKIE